MASISLKWDITNRCNLNCKHCLAGDRMRSGSCADELTRKQRLEVAGRLPATHVGHVNLIGGEPTVLGDEFFAVVETLTRQGIKTTFNTNGLKLRPTFIKRLFDSGAAGLILSLDGPSAETHDALRGKGTFDITRKNLLSLIRHVERHAEGFEITVNTVVGPHNSHVLPEMIALCLDMGVQALNLLPMSYTGSALENAEQLLLSERDKILASEGIARYYAQHPKAVEKLRLDCRFIKPPVVDYLERRYHASLPFPKICCGATTVFGYIDPMGRLYPCDRVKYEFPDARFNDVLLADQSLLDSDFFEIWNSRYFVEMFSFLADRDSYRNFEPCIRCEYFDTGHCVPCPLYAQRAERIRFYQCLFAEKQLGELRVSPRIENARAFGSHYVNQYQPVRKRVESIRARSAPDAPLKKAAGTRWNLSEGREVIFHPNTNKFYSITPLGKKIWELIDGENTMDTVCHALRKEKDFLTHPAFLPNQVEDFVSALESEGLVTTVERHG